MTIDVDTSEDTIGTTAFTIYDQICNGVADDCEAAGKDRPTEGEVMSAEYRNQVTQKMREYKRLALGGWKKAAYGGNYVKTFATNDELKRASDLLAFLDCAHTVDDKLSFAQKFPAEVHEGLHLGDMQTQQKAMDTAIKMQYDAARLDIILASEGASIEKG